MVTSIAPIENDRVAPFPKPASVPRHSKRRKAHQMLIIRKAQVDAFEESGLNNFENSMVDHVQMYFPNHHKIAGQDFLE